MKESTPNKSLAVPEHRDLKQLQLSNETKFKIMKAKCGELFTRISSENQKKLRQIIPKLDSYAFFGSREQINLVGTFLILNFGIFTTEIINTYDLLENYLDDKREEGDFEYTSELLIIQHMKFAFENKRYGDLVNHTIEYRALHKKYTIFLSEVNVNWIDENHYIKKLPSFSCSSDTRQTKQRIF